MRIVRWAAVAVGLGLVVSAALVGQASAKEGQSEVAEVRKATAQYHNEAKAIAAGYTPTDECIPQMGYHYVNYDLFGAPLDPLKPGALIYAPQGDDGRKLIGVEYFVVDSDQNPATHNSTVPSLFGRTFDGPMAGHASGMPVHYDLHAYIWTTNPDGTLATRNPDVTCPAD